VQGLAAAVIGAFTSARGDRGGGPAQLFSGMFSPPGRPEWPSGVQEEDAPRFALQHAAALRPKGPDQAHDQDSIDSPGDEVGEIIELFNRRLA
jgi:hypothetical protein